ncbi:MAG: nuclear transport factor 2 family protein [Chloracidobacterium sp.]|nr:nuclear transport factor 2 family protein [Chloracidobacterium sp.]
MKSLSLRISIFVVTVLCTAHILIAQNGPTADFFIALERHAQEAYDKGDSKFFEGLLSDKFVARQGNRRLSKSDFVDSVIGVKCDVKSRYLDEPWLAKVDADTYVFGYRVTPDGTCAGTDGKSMKIPGPARAATVWIRNKDKWQAAFHGSNLIVDPKSVPKPALSVEPAGKAAVNRSDLNPKALAAVERSVWKAWKDHDLKKLDSLTAKSLSFIDIFGNSYDNRDNILKTWSSPVCKIKSVNVTDPVAFLISPTVALLTHIGTADGTCYGEKLGTAPIYGNSIYIKDGRNWKLAFTMNMPAM